MPERSRSHLSPPYFPVLDAKSGCIFLVWMQNLTPKKNQPESFLLMKIVTVWFLWNMHLKLCLIQSRSCFCILFLWMSSIIFKRGFVSELMWTPAYAPKRWVHRSGRFHFLKFFKIIEPQSTEQLGLFPFILSYLWLLFFPSNQYCLRPFPWFSVPPTAPLSIAKQDSTLNLSPGGRAGIDSMKGK